MTGKAKYELGARQCLECGALLLVTSKNYSRLKYCPRGCRLRAFRRRQALRDAQRERMLQALQEE
jgi:hypothetical protein